MKHFTKYSIGPLGLSTAKKYSVVVRVLPAVKCVGKGFLPMTMPEGIHRVECSFKGSITPLIEHQRWMKFMIAVIIWDSVESNEVAVQIDIVLIYALLMRKCERAVYRFPA
mgnify:CR=1 FL=1